MPRKYTKKDKEYWNSLSKRDEPLSTEKAAVNWEPSSEPLISTASCLNYGGHGAGTATVGRLHGRADPSGAPRFPFLSTLRHPFDSNSGIISIRETISLTEAVYAHIATFKNVVDIMTEFSAAEWYLEGGNKASKKFIKKWLKKIRISSFMDQFFREYYRSGNVFIYAFFGEVPSEGGVKNRFKSKIKAPVRFIILNPKEIIAPFAPTYDDRIYMKVLSKYEIEALKNPSTEAQKQIWESLPEEIREKIRKNSYTLDGLHLSLSQDRLTTVFFKKQDYEPFAIPFGYPVFSDIEKKEMLKDLDMKISTTVENIILLITMGNEQDGVNETLLKKMQELFKTASVGRTLVSDWTTKAEFVVPDISNILDPRKYEILNKDIEDGLLNVFVGSEKFSNQMIKVQVFLERLKEGRKEFLERFLQPQIDDICESFGFKSAPQFKFTEIDLEDSVQLRRVWLRMLELGVFTPEQAMEAMRSGIMPDTEELNETQSDYVNKRKEGKFNPLVGGVPVIMSKEAEVRIKKEEAAAKLAAKTGAAAPLPAPTGNKGAPKKPAQGPNPTSTQNGRPSISVASKDEVYAVPSIKKVVEKLNGFHGFMDARTKSQYGLSSLSLEQEDAIFKVTESIIASVPMGDWESAGEKWLETNEISFADGVVKGAVSQVSDKHGISSYQAAILFHTSCLKDQ